MNALADKAHKQGMPQHCDMHALHNMATLFNNHPYLNSSKFSADMHVTANYLGMVAVAVFNMECISQLRIIPGVHWQNTRYEASHSCVAFFCLDQDTTYMSWSRSLYCTIGVSTLC